MHAYTIYVEDHATNKFCDLLSTFEQDEVVIIKETRVDESLLTKLPILTDAQDNMGSVSTNTESGHTTESQSETVKAENMKMEDLAGIFSKYVTHRISDEEIAEAVVAGAYQRGMAGKGDG